MKAQTITLIAILAVIFIFKLAEDPSRLGRWVKYGPLALSGHVHLHEQE